MISPANLRNNMHLLSLLYLYNISNELLILKNAEIKLSIMAKTKHEYIRSLMTPREKPVYEAKMHGSAILPGILLVVLAVITSTSPEVELPFVDEKANEMVAGLFATMHEMQVGIIFLGLGCFMSIRTWLMQHNNIHVVTNKRVIEVTGNVMHKVQVIWLYNLRSVKVKRTLIDRLFQRGNILISEKHDLEHAYDIFIPNVHEPVKFKEFILKARDRYGHVKPSRAELRKHSGVNHKKTVQSPTHPRDEEGVL